MKIKEKTLVVYKNRPALVSGFEGEKISITVLGGGSFKVREKDIEAIHAGPCSLSELEESAMGGNAIEGNAREAWELLSDGVSGESPAAISLREMAELTFGAFSPRLAWAAWELVREGIYFSFETAANAGERAGDGAVFVKPRSRKDVEEDEKKRDEKLRETEEREVFLKRFKTLPQFRFSGEVDFSLTQEDRRFLQDVEALALGKTDKSRTLKELGKNETSEDAHRLLLSCGAWTVWENPYPGRFGLSRETAKVIPPPPPEEHRLDLTHLKAFAIDNAWSDDPDDAISLETSENGENIIWVHVADPASSVLPGSPADTEARGRGATLYLPEGALRMLAEQTTSCYSLGVSSPISPALSFKVTLNANTTIKGTEIFPSTVNVTRLTYAHADELISGASGSSEDGDVLAALSAIAERNIERRLDTGAVMIEFPETHIQVTRKNSGENSIQIDRIPAYRSSDVVRECMLLAGEGAAGWALQRRLAFPYISQEAGELPGQRLSGLAGAWQLRKCMRPRSLSAKPGVHWGLGLDEYTQVTSPLRRYTDLLCHQQIRAWLACNSASAPAGAEAPLSEEDVLLRASAAEAAATATNRAERATRAHWLAVYLLDKLSTENPLWDAIILDRKGNRATVIIPDLGIETQVNARGAEKPNDAVKVKLLSVKIPEAEIAFALE